MIIGLTGSIASGKTTVSNILKERGFPIVDADEIARLVVEPPSPVLQQIERAFGKSVIREDGTLHREKLGSIIFNDEAERNRLNQIIHPAIRTEMNRQKEQHLKNGANTVIMDIPLLFESNLQSYVEKVIVVSVTEKIQKQRLMARNNLSEKEALARIASQLSMKVKEQSADAVIYNNHSIAETEQQLVNLLKEWKVEV